MGDRLAESEGFLRTEICGRNLLDSKRCKKKIHPNTTNSKPPDLGTYQGKCRLQLNSCHTRTGFIIANEKQPNSHKNYILHRGNKTERGTEVHRGQVFIWHGQRQTCNRLKITWHLGMRTGSHNLCLLVIILFGSFC